MNIFSNIFSRPGSNPVAPSPEKPSVRRISAAEAASLMEKESDYIVLDVRRNSEYASGHIPGALNLPNESIGSAEIPQLPDKNRLIMVHCLSGVRSRQAAGKLAALGYTNIVDFGGISSWQGPVVKD